MSTPTRLHTNIDRSATNEDTTETEGKDKEDEEKEEKEKRSNQ